MGVQITFLSKLNVCLKVKSLFLIFHIIMGRSLQRTRKLDLTNKTCNKGSRLAIQQATFLEEAGSHFSFHVDKRNSIMAREKSLQTSTAIFVCLSNTSKVVDLLLCLLSSVISSVKILLQPITTNMLFFGQSGAYLKLIVNWFPDFPALGAGGISARFDWPDDFFFKKKILLYQNGTFLTHSVSDSCRS